MGKPQDKFPILKKVDHLLNLAILTKDITLSRYYSHMIVKIAQKSLLKLPIYLKRIICKKCNLILIHGVTGNFHLIEEKRFQIYLMICCGCDYTRKIINSRK